MVLTIPLPLHPPLPEPLSLQSPEPDPNPNPYLEPHNPYTHQAVVRLARGKKAAAKAKAKARRVLSPAELSAPAKQLIAQLTSKEAQPVESLPNSPPPSGLQPHRSPLKGWLPMVHTRRGPHTEESMCICICL